MHACNTNKTQKCYLNPFFGEFFHKLNIEGNNNIVIQALRENSSFLVNFVILYGLQVELGYEIYMCQSCLCKVLYAAKIWVLNYIIFLLNMFFSQYAFLCNYDSFFLIMWLNIFFSLTLFYHCKKKDTEKYRKNIQLEAVLRTSQALTSSIKKGEKKKKERK